MEAGPNHQESFYVAVALVWASFVFEGVFQLLVCGGSGTAVRYKTVIGVLPSISSHYVKFDGFVKSR
jgi:hypothetical protein